MTLNIIKLASDVAAGRPTGAQGTTREKVYDPGANRHSVNINLLAPWEHEKTIESVVSGEWNSDVDYHLAKAEADFIPKKMNLGYYDEENDEWVSIRNSCAVVRPDKDGEDSVLAVGVTKEYATVAYKDCIKIENVPQYVMLDEEDKKEKDKEEKKILVGGVDLRLYDGPSGNTLRLWLQENGLPGVRDMDLSSVDILPLSDALSVAGINGWQGGKAFNAHFLMGETSPVKNRKVLWFLVYGSSLDGTGSGRWSLVGIDSKSKAILVHTRADGYAPLVEGVNRRGASKRTAKAQEAMKGEVENAFVEAVYAANFFHNKLAQLSKTSVGGGDEAKAATDFMGFISEAFNIKSVRESGRGKRDYANFSKITSCLTNPKYGLQGEVGDWLTIWLGSAAYIAFERQVNNVSVEEEKVEKLTYKQLVDEDSTLSDTWSILQKFAGFKGTDVLPMTSTKASTEV